MAISRTMKRRFCFTFSMAGKREWEQKKARGREEKARIILSDYSTHSQPFAEPSLGSIMTLIISMGGNLEVLSNLKGIDR